MSFNASIHVQRAERVPIGRQGTVRERAKYASDVRIEDLSETGCRFVADFSLPVGTLISLGIPGVGMHGARITREQDGDHGCAFLLPMPREAVADAQSAETVAPGNFPQMRERIRAAEQLAVDRRKTDRRVADRAPPDPKSPGGGGIGRLLKALARKER